MNDMSKHDISRRKFVATGALAVSGLALHLPGLDALKKDDTIRIGLIGTGSRGTGLAALLKELPAASIVACCDPLPQHLAEGMKLAAPKAKAYSHHRQLLEDPNVDAVIIATPLHTHYSIAVDALAAGKHIYLEKSMAYDIPQSLELVKKVRASSLVFQVGYQYRYYALYKRVKEVIKDNWAGKITGFECQYNQNSNWRRPNDDPKLERAINWRMYREYCGGPLSELCAHQIDMVNYLLDAHPVKAIGIAGINYWKDGRDTYDNIRTVYEYPGGVQSSVTSILSNGYKDYNIRILGDKATIEIMRDKAFIYAEPVNMKKATVDGVTGATVKAYAAAQPLEYGSPGTNTVEPTIYSLADFFDCIRNKRKPVSNVETAHYSSVSILLGNMAADKTTSVLWLEEYNAST